jgi:methylglyoxal synthase
MIMETFIRNKTKPYSNLLFASGHDDRATGCDGNASNSSGDVSSFSASCLLDPDFESVFRPTQMRCLALVSHNEMKAAMKTFVIANKNILKKFRLTGTNSTMSMLREVFAGDESVIFGPSCSSGPLGGDAELVALMCAGELGGMIFFQDPMSAHPHQSDIDCLCRQAIVHNSMIAGNPTSALMMMTTLRVALKENQPELIPSFFCTLQSPSVGAYKKQQQEVILSHSQHRREFDAVADEQQGEIVPERFPAESAPPAIQQSSYDPQALVFESVPPPVPYIQQTSAREVQGSISTAGLSRRKKSTLDNTLVSLRKNAISPSNHADEHEDTDTVASFASIASRRRVDAEEKLAMSIAKFVKAMAASTTKSRREAPGAGVTQHGQPHVESSAALVSKSHHSYFNDAQNRRQLLAKANEHDKLSSTSRSADIMTSSNSARKIATSDDTGTVCTIGESSDSSLPLSTNSSSTSSFSHSTGETAKSAARRSRQQQVPRGEKSYYKPTSSSSRRQQQRMVTRFAGSNRK